jgi:hypothetical protein
MDASDVFRQQTNRHYMFMEIQIVFDMTFGAISLAVEFGDQLRI